MKLFLLDLGRIQPLNIPVPGYVIQTDAGQNILIDTGFPLGYIDQPNDPPGMHYQMHAENYVVRQLALVGLTPSDIHVLICSHFDEDHAGNHHLFTQARLVVQRQHYELARAGEPRYAATRPSWDAPGLHYTLVEGDAPIAPGVEVLESSGHVPGHQAVLVRLPQTGPVLLAIDAIPAAFTLDAAMRPILPTDLDEAGVRASTRKLVELAAREQVTLLIHGHDLQQWLELKHAPAYYE